MIRKARWFAAALCAAVVGTGVVAVLPQRTVLADHHGGEMKKKDIIDTATGPGMQKVTTVVAAIKAAGLVETLKGKGPFTVFAPTNEAFEKLPKGTVEELLKPENKEKLTSILTYHVHSGKAIMAKDVVTMKLSTVNGKDIDVKVDDTKGVMLNDAKVIKTDVVCSNGVIHWIDTVLMPPAAAAAK